MCGTGVITREYSIFSKLRDFARPNVGEQATEKAVVDFTQPSLALDTLLTRSDEDLGGFSTVSLSLKKEPNRRPFARFEGEISLDLPEDRPDVVRLGYAMLRTKDLPPSLLGMGSSSFHDWSQFSQLSMRVRGDYRKYFVNIQADTPYPTDLYQHRLFLRTPGEWETVTVSFSNFILTNGGVIQHQERLDTSAVRSVGISLIDGQYGPYQLDIDWIKVHNGSDSVEEQSPNSIDAVQQEPLPSGSPIGAETQDGTNTNRTLEGTPPVSTSGSKTPGKRLSVDD